MKKILILISLSLLLFSCKEIESEFHYFFKPQKEEIQVSQDFVQGSEDIPLLLGMEKVSDDSVGFDSNSGSIISSSYVTKIDHKKVRNFYIQTLPQMGWKVMKNTESGIGFLREKEKLEIEFLNEEGELITRFFISSSL